MDFYNDEPSFSQEECSILFRMSQQTKRYKDMMEFATLISQSEGDLIIEEREMIASAYKTAISVKKQELDVLENIYVKEEEAGNMQNLTRILHYKELIEEEIINLCNEILQKLDDTLLPKSKANTSSYIYYTKLKGDFSRYLCEISLDPILIQQTLDSYQETERLSQNLPPTSLIVLGLKLNLSLFYWEILHEKETAKKIAAEAFEKALKNINNVEPQEFSDCSDLMQLICDNLTLWNIKEETILE